MQIIPTQQELMQQGHNVNLPCGLVLRALLEAIDSNGPN